MSRTESRPSYMALTHHMTRRMQLFSLTLLCLAVLSVACGDDEANEADERVATDRAQDVLADADLKSALLRDLPGLTSDEADCLGDAIISGLPDPEEALDDQDRYADAILASARAAQERCLTANRLAELEAAQVVAVARQAGEQAFLLVARGVAGGLDGTDEDLIDAGYQMCELAADAGSFDELIDRLAVTPAASARAAADLVPLLRTALTIEELITFSTIAVVALCPEDEG